MKWFNRVFLTALLISLSIHSLILLSHPSLSPLPIRAKMQKMEVSYVKAEEPKPIPGAGNKGGAQREPFFKIPSRISIGKGAPPPFVDKEAFLKNSKVLTGKEIGFGKPLLEKPDILASKKKISFPPIDMDKISNPTYISYYQIVREKIKRAAYQAYQNYNSKEVGEVTVAFVVSNDGYLKDLRLIEEKTSFSPNLRELALQSIRDASPFPNFPKELDYQRLSFNLVITFELEQD